MTSRALAIAWGKDISPTTVQGHVVVAKGIDDATVCMFDQAKAVLHGEYYIVWPEHHECQVFHKAEYDVRMYKIVAIEEK